MNAFKYRLQTRSHQVIYIYEKILETSRKSCEIFKKFCWNKIKKQKNKNFMTKKNKKIVFLFIFYITSIFFRISWREFSKYIKKHFLKV